MSAAATVFDFTGKVALITGASSGIGAATAKCFAKLGANLSITGRDEANLNQVAEECRKLSAGDSNVFTIIGDLKIEEDVENILNSTIKHYGKLDILVNNAGILVLSTIETTSLKEFDEVMNINVRSVYHLTMLAVPHLIKTKGNIVNVSSVNGLRSFAGVLPYNISKSAVDQLTRCVALELASKSVRVNSVNPGVTITDAHKRAGVTGDKYTKFLERTKETHPLGRAGEPEEVAWAIAYLASDASSYTTGANLPVDGGRHATCLR